VSRDCAFGFGFADGDEALSSVDACAHAMTEQPTNSAVNNHDVTRLAR
jgi:hypothetical protein